MDTVFNIKRFWNLGKRSFFLSKIHYLYILGGLTGLYILSMLLYILVEVHLSGVLFMVAGFIIVTSPCFLEKNINRHSGVFDFMTPASSFEKYLNIWVKNILIFPILIFAVIFLLNLISGIIPNESVNEHAIKMSTSNIFKSNTITFLLSTQAYFLAGHLYFKKYAFAKTTLTILSFYMLLICIGIIVVYMIYQGGSMTFNLSSNTEASHITAYKSGQDLGESISLSILHDKTIKILNIVVGIVMIGGLWIVSFFKLRETEI